MVIGFDFGDAIDAIKRGKVAYRKDWHDSYIYYVPANSYPASTNVAKKEFGDKVPYQAYIAIKTESGDVAPYTPSMSDILSNDWKSELMEPDFLD